MDSVPRRWVLKPMSPPLQPSDLRSIAGSASSWTDEVVRAQRVTLPSDGGSSSSGDELRAVSPVSTCSSSGSVIGFYSFVEDPSSQEAQLNEEWMLSPLRRAQLATLKEEKAFTLQTYAGDRKPGSLFDDRDDEVSYRVDGAGLVAQEAEEQQLRRDIIRSQAPKVKSAPESADSPDSRRLADPDAEDQIDFNAARQQFLQLERDRPSFASTLSPPPMRSTAFWGSSWQSAAAMFGPSTRSQSGESKAKQLSVDVSPADERPVEAVAQRLGDGSETPIEREVRLLREREKKQRRLRSLVPVDQDSIFKIPTVRPPRSIWRNGENGAVRQERTRNNSEDETLPCCPHRHAENGPLGHVTRNTTSSSDTPRPSSPSWRDSAGLQPRGGGAWDLIEQEIQEALQREAELQVLRAETLASVTLPKMAAGEPVSCRPARPSSLSSSDGLSPGPPLAATPRRRTDDGRPSPALSRPASRDLSEMLLQDRRLKLGESAYAGIQPVDDINNQVVESTRVARHKSQRALRWEAGVFANREDQ